MKLISFLMVTILTLTACSGSTAVTADNLMSGIKRNDIAPIVLDDPQENHMDKTTQVMDFSLSLFEEAYEEKNMLISPLSVTCALSMVANGAKNETLVQLEEALGTDIGSLNEYLYAYNTYLPTDDKYKVGLANSIWFKDEASLTVTKEFLQTNKDYYDAEIYKAPFDNNTKNDINAWVDEKTHGQIGKILDEKISENSVMYLINALSFDAEWLDIYQDNFVNEGEFITHDAKKRTVDFMYSTEYSYIELPTAIGFSKPYADEKYSFVGLLPDKELTIEEFISSLDGQVLIEAVKNKQDEKVQVFMPKFSFDYDTELSGILKKMGITDAFDMNAANFSALGQSTNGNIFINRVIHKTKIEVNEKGTKAGAITAIEMKSGSVELNEPKIINLNRPFFFMLVDNEFSMPIFIGVLNDIP